MVWSADRNTLTEDRQGRFENIVLVKTRKYCYAIILLILWMILLFSTIGHIVAGVTIFGSVALLFICGCLSLNRKSDKSGR
jgi:uncharacterized membrane protein